MLPCRRTLAGLWSAFSWPSYSQEDLAYHTAIIFCHAAQYIDASAHFCSGPTLPFLQMLFLLLDQDTWTTHHPAPQASGILLFNYQHPQSLPLPP